MIRGILIGCLGALCAVAASAQTPEAVEIRIPGGNSFLQSTDLTGTLTSADFTCTWSVGNGTAVFDWDGPFVSLNYYYPHLTLQWGELTEPLPLHFAVTNPGDGALSFAGGYLDPSLGWVYPYYQETVAGDWQFGQQFPVSDGIELEFNLDTPSTPYDLHLSMQWGPGVPSETVSWDAVKALYRR